MQTQNAQAMGENPMTTLQVPDERLATHRRRGQSRRAPDRQPQSSIGAPKEWL